METGKWIDDPTLEVKKLMEGAIISGDRRSYL